MQTKNTFQQIEAYINSKQNAWAPSTLASESARLYCLVHLIATMQPACLHAALKTKYAPYTLKTVFTRIAEFKQFVGDNSYKEFMQSNARLFKNAYTKKTVGMDFTEATSRIAEIANEPVRKIAELMLTTGLRVHEAMKYDGSGEVIGKGLKKRPVFSNVRITEAPGYHTIRRELAKVGLCPHDLRKLAATKLADSGMRNVDLMEVMGWSSMETASSYLQTSATSRLAAQVKGALQSRIILHSII